MGNKDLEKRFLEWVSKRDDDWWENGQGHIGIWDVRVMLDFIAQEKKKSFEEGYKLGMKTIKTLGNILKPKAKYDK